MSEPVKLCECGCGMPAPIAKHTRTIDGHVKGQPVRFIRGHRGRLPNSFRRPIAIWDDLPELYVNRGLSTLDIAVLKGCCDATVCYQLARIGIPRRSHGDRFKHTYANHPRPHRERAIRNGYVWVYAPDHPAASYRGMVLEHRLVVEKRLGRYLLPSEHVHHIDGVKNHNDDSNLAVLSPADHTVQTKICKNCEVRKEIRLLRWQVKELTQALQLKLGE